jgi:hypothetical protein
LPRQMWANSCTRANAQCESERQMGMPVCTYANGRFCGERLRETRKRIEATHSVRDEEATPRQMPHCPYQEAQPPIFSARRPVGCRATFVPRGMNTRRRNLCSGRSFGLTTKHPPFG